MSAVLTPKKQLIPISEWAKICFPARTPVKNTLHKWIHQGRIYPQPEKVGKNWYVQPSAEYQGD
jgi:hypothetical protein